MEIVTNIAKEIVIVILEMSPYLLFGFFLAGVLKLLIPQELLYKHLSKRNLSSIIKASILGVPLPLCSCGIIPLAGHLKKEGASKSSIISFLTSTPTTGVDSIFATYALLGPLFAIIRPVIALVAGIFSGIMDFIFAKEFGEVERSNTEFSCVVCDDTDIHSHNNWEKIKYVFNYAFVEMIEDLGKWLAIGIVISGIISGLVPTSIVNSYLSNPLIAYFAMIIIGLPLYVCSTGSIPIAASFIKLGIAPGAALIFLIVGPATNAATISFVGGKLGKRTLFIYLLSMIIVALASGFAFDSFFSAKEISMNIMNMQDSMLPHSIKVISSAIFIGLLLNVLYRKYFGKPSADSCCAHDNKDEEASKNSCCSKNGNNDHDCC